MPATDPDDPRRPIAPLAETPSLTRVAVRRTTTVEMQRPDGLEGRAVVTGSGRDLLANEAAHRGVAEEASTRLETNSLEDPRLRSIATSPARPALDAMIGNPASAGFRARLGELLGDEPAGSLLWRLCWEVPNLYVIGGFASQHSRRPLGDKSSLMLSQSGVCAGWRENSVLMRGLAEQRMVPVVIGPPAPPVARDDEPDGWHAEEPMAPLTVRRRRRLDVHHGGATAQVWFRDSFQPVDGAEMVIHEYTIDLRVEGDAATIASLDVTAHVLPWGDCPSAVASAQRMVGEPLAAVAERARRELHGETTCTHLNACVASISDLDALRSRAAAAIG